MQQPSRTFKWQTFWEKYQVQILSLILALYTLPNSLSRYITTELDGSWVRAVNIAIKKHFVFGNDFIFTYGPLGYFATRNTQYISSVFLVAADVFLVSGFYYIFCKLLSKTKGWFVILLISIFYYKSTAYAQQDFLMFILFAVLIHKNKFSNYLELVYCAFSGVVVFFIKVNYGIIAFPILFYMAIMTAITSIRSFLVFSISALLLFTVIYLNVHIDIVNYIKYSIPLITGYEDAMMIIADPFGLPYITTVINAITIAAAMGYYVWQLKRGKNIGWFTLMPLPLFGLTFFLQYKNGFTRADGHYLEFLTAFPFFLVMLLLLLDINGKAARITVICILFICDLSLNLPGNGSAPGFIYKNTIGPLHDYLSEAVCGKNADAAPYQKIPESQLNLIGNAPIDVIPIDIATVQLNNLNYAPRPVIQSYSAYTTVLDSLNAAYFYRQSRPAFVMIKSEAIDGRYEAWDESLTKAVLHLNYEFRDSMLLNGAPSLDGSSGYLLLHAKGNMVYPKFEKLYEQTINLEDTVHINFPGDKPVYVIADVEYNIPGRIKNLLFQVPMLSVSLFFNDSCTQYVLKRAIRPEMKGPELISHTMLTNRDLKNYITGNISSNTPIKAFSFHATGRGCKKKIKLTFLRFSNY